LLERPYDDFLESSFQIEEALEGFPAEHLKYIGASLFEIEEYTPKHISRYLTTAAQVGPGGPYSKETEISDVDRFDKAIDAVVFAIGSMAKLGLTPQQIQRGILAVNRANVQKLGMPRDEHGKLIKPKDFVGPEVELQKILDER